MKHKLYVALIRTLRTFVQGFIAQLILTNFSYTQQALIAATMAGIAAVWTLGTGGQP